MLYLHPISRAASALFLLAATFLANSLTVLVAVYSLVLLILLVSRVCTNHIRFIFFVTTPLLIALLVLGWAIKSQQLPIAYKNGVSYALFQWLRIVTWGGVLQFLFIPLVNQPIYLKDFLTLTGFSNIGTLIIASIVFLPEMRRRLAQIIDARRAQGITLNGLRGIRDVPMLLMPLVSSLMDSATKRAELWSHRGLLIPNRDKSQEIAYNGLASIFVPVFAFVSCIAVILE